MKIIVKTEMNTDAKRDLSQDHSNGRIRRVCEPSSVFYCYQVQNCRETDWDELVDCIVTRVSDRPMSEQCPLVVVWRTGTAGPMAAYEAPRGSSDEEAVYDGVGRYVAEHPEGLRIMKPPPH
jgi:hypothetical protein